MFLTRYEPDRLYSQLNKEFFRNFANPDAIPKNPQKNTLKSTLNYFDSNASTDWVPQVDVKEQENQYVIIADIPGIEPKDIEITLDKGVLSISGQRDTEKSTEQDGYQCVERSQGRFIRRFSIPDAVDENKISAKGKNGVLELVIPKVEKILPRKITVQA